MSKKVTIIIPCYNTAKYLPACIESVLNQTYQNIEIILIDDGSTDSTSEICNNFLKKDVRILYYYQVNQGVSSARNLGIKKASGSKIMFIDSDDYIHRDMLLNLIKPINFENKFEISICGINHVKKGKIIPNIEFSKLITNKIEFIDKCDILTLFKYDNLSTPCCKLYDIDVLKENNINFNTRITYQEDLIFNLEYFKYINKIFIIPFFGYFYTEHPNSSTVKYHKELFESLPIIFKSLKSYNGYDGITNYLKIFFLNQILKNIYNINHIDSDLTWCQKYVALKKLFNNEIYNFSKKQLGELKINLILRYFIKFKLYFGIMIFYKIHKIYK